MGVHTRIQAAPDILGKGIGCHGNDGDGGRIGRSMARIARQAS